MTATELVRLRASKNWYIRVMLNGTSTSGAVVFVKTARPNLSTGKADIPLASPADMLRVFRALHYPVGIVFEEKS